MRHMLRRWLLPLTVLGFSAAAGTALAQDADFRRPDFGNRGVGVGNWVFVPSLKSVFQQDRDDYSPLGIHMGAWMLEPELQLDGIYDDNVFADESDEESDLIGEVTPAFRLRSNTSVHMLGIEGSATVTRFADNDSQDTEEGRLAAFGRLDVTRNDTVFASGGYERETLGRNDPDDDEDSELTRVERIDGRLGYIREFSRVAVRLDSQARHLNFLNRDDQDRDRNELDLTGRVTYAWLPRFSPFVETGVLIQDFGNPDDATGANRDATHYSALVGTRVLITDIMTGEFAIGAFHSEFEENTFDSVTSIGFSGEVTWNITPLTSIIAQAERGATATTQGGASSRIETSGLLRVERELLRNVLIYGQAGYVNFDYRGIDRTDEIYSAGFGGEYMINRGISLVASYDFDLRDSSESGRDFERNVVLLGLRLQY